VAISSSDNPSVVTTENTRLPEAQVLNQQLGRQPKMTYLQSQLKHTTSEEQVIESTASPSNDYPSEVTVDAQTTLKLVIKISDKYSQ
jgi:hypothetical protein